MIPKRKRVKRERDERARATPLNGVVRYAILSCFSLLLPLDEKERRGISSGHGLSAPQRIYPLEELETWEML